MLRVRLKADGRLVEILPDGSERLIASDPQSIASAAYRAARAADSRGVDAAYARSVRGRTGLEFIAVITDPAGAGATRRSG